MIVQHANFPLALACEKKIPTSPVFPLQNLHFKQVEPDLWGPYFSQANPSGKLQVQHAF